MLCSAAAFTSIEAFRRPVVMSSLRSESFARSARSKGVRSRIAITISALFSAAATPSRSEMCRVTDVSSTRPLSRSQSPNFRATFW
jgi:hypothetical protein